MIYRYCPYAHLDDMIKVGWVPLGPTPGPGGFYSMMVVWQCDCPAPWFKSPN
jgi:hypothetical protein